MEAMGASASPAATRPSWTRSDLSCVRKVATGSCTRSDFSSSRTVPTCVTAVCVFIQLLLPENPAVIGRMVARLSGRVGWAHWRTRRGGLSSVQHRLKYELRDPRPFRLDRTKTDRKSSRLVRLATIFQRLLVKHPQESGRRRGGSEVDQKSQGARSWQPGARSTPCAP